MRSVKTGKCFARKVARKETYREFTLLKTGDTQRNGPAGVQRAKNAKNTAPFETSPCLIVSKDYRWFEAQAATMQFITYMHAKIGLRNSVTTAQRAGKTVNETL